MNPRKNQRQDLNKTIIEINDIEYLIDENASKLIAMGADDIALTRLVDQAVVVFERKEIENAIKRGIVDRLD